jgi:hypothetical protein
MDPENFSVSLDARPTGNVNGFSIAIAMGRGGQGSVFIYHTGEGGAWTVHSNGDGFGNIISGGTVTYNTWQNLRLERVNGSLSFYVDNVQVGSPTSKFTSTGSFGDTLSIGAHYTQSGNYEGRFQGQIDNVHLITPPLPPADADDDGLLDKWETAHGLSIASGTGNDGPTGDPDGDGATNLHEFAFGGDPQSASDRGAVLSTVVDLSGERHFAYTFAARSGVAFGGSGPLRGSRDGVDYEVTGSGDLTNFILGLTEVTPAVATGLPAAPAGYSYYTIRLTDPVSAAGTGFIRAKAAPTPAPAP